MMTSASLLQENRWDKKLAEAIIANFRTAGIHGFRGNSLLDKELQEKGWRYFHQRTLVDPHPHFEAWMWACYLWLYDKTQYQPLLKVSKDAISQRQIFNAQKTKFVRPSESVSILNSFPIFLYDYFK